MSNYKEHANREFKAIGYTPLDQEQEDGPNKWVQENVLELLEVFSKQGHSGSSAPFVISYFKKLANFDPLSPIKCTDDEWNDSLSGGDSYQNNRLSSVFKAGKDGKPYYLYAIMFRTQKDSTWSGSATTKDGEIIGSQQYIKLPFVPKTFYIDVIEEEVEKDSWVFHIKDESQLKDVFEYYELKERP